ncbi:hypothetical protein [Levilactobacillus bambusae]|uniref:Uncharacterized protein n=1 Tax=Levilactobacillus bambusae TaxID=2024736 RepID=A0A2V1N0V8_9LACO|nr:hypothetical protein [Levilactobacillus bambusae]PWF99949.1 hypothetical protein DCM90_03100 [Levilactobacillus bambusae]
MDNARLKIDPEKFAYHYLDSLEKEPVPNGKGVERSVKDRLFAYLSAYVLIERFNQLEVSHFDSQPSINPQPKSLKDVAKNVARINQLAAQQITTDQLPTDENEPDLNLTNSSVKSFLENLIKINEKASSHNRY